MKKKLSIFFSIIIFLVLILSLYFANIPSPSKLITETYQLNVK